MVASLPGPPDPSIHTHSAYDELHPYPPHIRSLTQEHRNAKQERWSTEECETNVDRNAECEGKIEERGHAGTKRSTGTRTHLCGLCLIKFILRNLSYSPFREPGRTVLLLDVQGVVKNNPDSMNISAIITIRGYIVKNELNSNIFGSSLYS